MDWRRSLVGLSAASVVAFAGVGIASGAAGDNDSGYGSKGIATVPTGNAGTSSANAAVLQSGKLLVVGQATQSTGAGDVPEIALTRLNADGGRDTGFGTNGQTLTAAGTGQSAANAVALTPDGKIVIAGSAVVGGTTQIAVARYLATGQPDPAFGTGGLTLFARGAGGSNAEGDAVLVQPDGTIIVASTVVDGAVKKISMDRVAANGTPDNGWHSLTSAGSNTDTEAHGIVRLGDGSLAVVGQTDDGNTKLLVSRYAAATGLLTAGWGTLGNGISLRDLGDGGTTIGNAITVSGTRIIAAGSSFDDNFGKTFVASFDQSNGAISGGFGTGGATLAPIGSGGKSEANAVATDSAGRIVVGGDATQDDGNGGSPSQFVAARFTSAGTLDTTFASAAPLPGASLVGSPGQPAFGAAIAIQSDDKIIVAGRVGDGNGETLAAARYCATTDQACSGPGAANNGGGGGTPTPTPPAPFECGKTVTFGPISAQGCLQAVGDHFEATGRVDVNGIIMQPSAQATIIIDPKHLHLYVDGPGKKPGTLSARVGTITLFEDLPLDITLPNVSIGSFSLPDLAVSGHGSIYGFPITGKIDLTLAGGGVQAAVQVGLPSLFGGVSGQVTLRADLATGLHLDGIQITAKDAMLGPLEIKDLLISYTDSTKLWTGSATVFIQPFPYGAGGVVQIQNGALKTVVATVAGLNVPIGEVAFLQRLSFGISTDPFTIIGGIGITAGPQVAGGAAVSVDGNFRLSFPGDPLAKMEISSNAFCLVSDCPVGGGDKGSDGLKVVGLPLGGFSFSADTNGQIAFAGNLGLDVGIASIQANLSGWLDGVKAFDIEGGGQVCVFVVACVGADGVISSEGLAACGYAHLLTVKVAVGFGIKWPFDLSVMAGTCDIGPYRATHATGASLQRLGVASFLQTPAPQSVTFPDKDYSLVRFTGDSGPPLVDLKGPDGTTITTPAAPAPGAQTDRSMVFKDYAKKQTIVVVTKPGSAPWTVTPQAGSPAIVTTEQADTLPPAQVKAKVTGTAYSRTLTYDTKAIDGQSVRFSEVGGGVTHMIGMTSKAHGSFTFTPRDGKKGSRKIVAQVIQGGIPRTELTAATYSAPSRRLPAKAKSLTVRRGRGRNTSLTISWPKIANADTIRILVKVDDGRTLMFNEPGKIRKIAVPDILTSEGVKVSLKGVTASLHTGPAATASIKAAPVKKKKSTKKKGS